MPRMNGPMIVGFILLVAGVLGYAIPVFTTQKTENLVKLGDIKIQSTQDVPHSIPPIFSGGVLALGVVLIGMGLLKKS